MVSQRVVNVEGERQCDSVHEDANALQRKWHVQAAVFVMETVVRMSTTTRNTCI
jgi:hypothetical protein